MLLKDFLLDNLVVPLKGIYQIKGDAAVWGVIPYLHQIDSGAVPKKRIVEVKPLLFLLDFLPVAGIKAEITAGLYMGIHLGKRMHYILV